MSRFFLLLVVPLFAACGGADTSLMPPILIPNGNLPTGTAEYAGTLATTAFQNFDDGAIAYRETTQISGAIALNADFSAGVITASITNPGSDVERSSTMSAASQYNFVDERSYTGTLTGTGTTVATVFSSALSGDLTLTSVGRVPVAGPTERLTGTMSGRVTGDAFQTATGRVTVNQIIAGQESPLFEDIPFEATAQ